MKTLRSLLRLAVAKPRGPKSSGLGRDTTGCRAGQVYPDGTILRSEGEPEPYRGYGVGMV
jgi:hypothetical protein